MAEKKFSILETQISAIDIDDACWVVEEAISQRQKKYICVCPVSTIMGCRRNSLALESVNSADLCTPDGMPVVWIGKIKGHHNIKRVYGPDLMLALCKISEKKGYKNYFYGSTDFVLEKLKQRIENIFPGLSVSGMYSPPFRQINREEDDKIVEDINNTNSDIIWVGLGSPKQDIWMYRHRDRINAPVMIGVGAAFDFLAKTKPQAPKWMRENGFEWLFRLVSEPKRLWRRYLIDNSLFVYYAGRELFKLISPSLRSGPQ